MGELKRGRVILVAYLIATIELTFVFMQLGVMPVSMGYWVLWHFLPSMPIVKSSSKVRRETKEESVFLCSRQAVAAFRACSCFIVLQQHLEPFTSLRALLEADVSWLFLLGWDLGVVRDPKSCQEGSEVGFLTALCSCCRANCQQ